MSTLSISTPMESHGFMAKAGALAVGTALAGTALFGGVAAVPTIAGGLTGSVQHDYVLTATPSPEVDSFTQSLQNLLDALKFGTVGDVLGLLGTKDHPITSDTDLSVLLAGLNPKDLTLNDVTGNLFGQNISALLDDVKIAGPDHTAVGLGSVPIDALLGGFIGGAGADTTLGALLTDLGLGPYAGLLNLPFLGISPNDTVAGLLNSMLGISATTTLNSLAIGNGETLGTQTLGGLLGIDGSEQWDKFIDGLSVGGTLTTPGTPLGDESLGALLTSLLPVGSTDTIGDDTTITGFLTDLGIFSMLGLS